MAGTGELLAHQFGTVSLAIHLNHTAVGLVGEQHLADAGQHCRIHDAAQNCHQQQHSAGL